MALMGETEINNFGSVLLRIRVGTGAKCMDKNYY
jgi:hypothetical protein